MADRLEQLQKLQAADPNDADVPYMLALEHAKRGDLADAFKWLDKTLSLEPRYLYAYFQKGKLLAQQGDEATARSVLEAGIKMAAEVNDAKALSELEGLLESITS